MVVGLSDGTVYADEQEWLATTDTRADRPPQRVYITGQTDSTMPLGSGTEPAGALKQTGGTQTPGNSEKVEIRAEPYGLNPPEGSGNIVKGIGRFLAKTATNIATLPQRAIENSQYSLDTGNYDPSVPMEAAGTAVLGSFPIAKALGGVDGTLGSFAGVKSATIKDRLADLGHAQVLEASGMHPDEIWKTTGFGRGAEGRWRYEINDSTANFNPTWYEGAPTEKWSIDRYQNPNAGTFTEGTKVDKLSAILDHPELYKAYPHLKDVLVKMDPAYAKEGAMWNNSNTITMGSEAAKNQGTLMHEVQHAIQDFEGFAKGGSPRSDAGYLKYTPDMKALEPEMREMIRKADTPGYTFTTKDIERKNYLTQVAQKYREYTEAAYKQAHEFYERLAGETESRNVDTRLLLTEAERRKFPPTWTEDLPRSKQIPRDRPTSTTAYGIVEGGKYVKPPAYDHNAHVNWRKNGT